MGTTNGKWSAMNVSSDAEKTLATSRLGRVRRNCAHGTGYFAKMLTANICICAIFIFFAVQLKHTLNFFVRLIYANLNAARNRNEICVEIIDEGRFQAYN